MHMDDLESRLSAMENRLRLLEDRTEILQLMAAYGPAMDTCDTDSVAAIWTKDGIYDTDGYRFEGAQQVGQLAVMKEHVALVKDGAAHVIGMPHVVIAGDRATAIGYSRVYHCTGDSHEVMRASSNLWEFVRTPRGWRVANRINRRLAGSDESRSLLARLHHPLPEAAIPPTPGGLLREFWDRVAEHRVEEAISLLDPEGRFWCRPIGSIPMRGFFEILRGVQRAVPMTFTVHDAMENGDHAMLENECHGHFASGEAYNNRYVWIAHVRDGRIVELREYSDTAYSNDVFTRNLPPEVMETIASFVKL